MESHDFQLETELAEILKTVSSMCNKLDNIFGADQKNPDEGEESYGSEE